MFTTFPSYPRYRTLGPATPALMGEDVYALQTGLNVLKFGAGATDGVFGGRTLGAVKMAQKDFHLEVDGLVGGITWRALALRISDDICDDRFVPRSANKGQLEFESGYRGGIYSARRAEGDYDAGVAQRNTRFHPPRSAFNMPESIAMLTTNTRKYYDLFEGVPSQFRRWSLAQGAWNAPAFACYFARAAGAKKVTTGMIARPSVESARIFEEYMSRASVYLTL